MNYYKVICNSLTKNFSRHQTTSMVLSEECADHADYHETIRRYVSDVNDHASLTSDSGSNFDDIPLDKRLNDEPEVEEASLSVNTKCHKRKTIADFPLSDCTRSFTFDDDDDNDGSAVKCSLEDSEDMFLKFKHQEGLTKSCSFVSAVKEIVCLPDDKDMEVKLLTLSSDPKSKKLHPCCLDGVNDGVGDDDDDDLLLKGRFEEDSEVKCRELKCQESLTSTCSFSSAVEGPGQLAEDQGMEVKQLTRSTDLKIEERLHLCCFACQNSLGLSENCFLIPCSVSASSKPYLSSFLENGCTRIRSPGSPPRKEHVAIAVADVWNVDQRVLRGPNSGKSRRADVWNEEDGCVFRPINCPFCHATSATLLGLQIMATDASNAHLLNKVMVIAPFDKSLR